MRSLVFVLLLAPALAGADPKPSADPTPAPNLFDQRQPRPVTIVDATRDGDRAGDRSCEPNSRGQVECHAPAAPTKQPTAR